ncbi:uncharacterized protein LOC132259874 [Phlebotomus argentipes]|uniref:uncharacterized protein LOC132259874 n=1 Tax=Phlebotomus argentipes TaxID=94469 RepID=UPI002892A78D|nr:uncharacterized protein LOC132259874 [Phlebotomus argentipes]
MDAAQPSNNTQQFCLRWHNHQASLLSSLPLLLDQSHLTDVTLSAEGRTVRAHRVVLSACSTFFSELFRTLDPPYHPVVVLPGASFGATVALLTFMYSGEVNVFEEQISSLLSLAETLGIKGLADFNGNAPKASPKRETASALKDTLDMPAAISAKVSSPLETLFSKPFPFYPNLLPQPINFSQSANRACDLFARYQSQAGKFNLLAQDGKNHDDHLDEENNNRRMYNEHRKHKADMKKIDKIAENLRTSNKNYLDQQQLQKGALVPQSPPTQAVLKPPPPLPAALQHHFMSDDTGTSLIKSENTLMEAPHPSHAQPATPAMTPDPMTAESMLEKSIASAISKPGNSKLYATCFICHKQLSNQYNLRVHLETHQNVRYACTVCSHVSRSKDALRKHVSYRHPGAPSPCESETRRKRAKMMGQPIKQEMIDPQTLLSSLQQQQVQMAAASTSQTPIAPPCPSPQQAHQIPTPPDGPSAASGDQGATNLSKDTKNHETMQ